MFFRTHVPRIIVGFIAVIICFLLLLPYVDKLGVSSPSVPPAYPSPTMSENIPGKILDLTNWKLTLPIGNTEHPTEIKQPQLSTFSDPKWFFTDKNQHSVVFRAPVSAVTTTGSNYPRSELREMTNNGADKASWSSTSGTHEMDIEEAITEVPKTKKHVVAGQIHDGSDDIIVIRLEYPNLYVNVGGKNLYTLDKNYTLGKRFSIKFLVHDGKTDVYYNNSSTPVYTLTKNFKGAYFKAGVYTQSNCSREASQTLCNETNLGEVRIFSLKVKHS